MRTSAGLLGIALVIAGVIWIFQGAGTLKGSFMTGSTFWLVMGVVAVVIGIPLVVAGFRGGARPPGA